MALRRVRLALVGALLAPLVLAAVVLGASFVSVPAGAVTTLGSLLHVTTEVTLSANGEPEGIRHAHGAGDTLYVVPDNQVITYGDALPEYTFTLHSGSPAGALVSPTIAVAPICTSSYDGTWAIGRYAGAITCSGGSDGTYGFDTTSTATLVINKATLFVVPDPLTVLAKEPAPAYTYSFHAGSPDGPAIPITVATPPYCASNYNTAMTEKSPPVTIYCAGGADPNVTFDDSATAVLTIDPPHLKPQAALHISVSSTGIAGVPLTLTTTGGSGSHHLVFRSNSANCSVRGDQLTYSGTSSSATCVVTA